MKRVPIIFVLALAAPMATGYEVKTHSSITLNAQQQARIKTGGAASLGELGVNVDDFSSLSLSYFDMSGKSATRRHVWNFEQDLMAGIDPGSVAGWILRGAIREDDLDMAGCIFNSAVMWVHGNGTSGCNPQDDPYGNFSRVVNHFFDPLVNPSTQAGLPMAKSAPSWALGVVAAFATPLAADTSRRNHFSIIDARRSMLYALRGRDASGNAVSSEDRKAYWATAFRSLGDAMHLVQDMAQPQHIPRGGASGQRFRGLYRRTRQRQTQLSHQRPRGPRVAAARLLRLSSSTYQRILRLIQLRKRRAARRQDRPRRL